MLMTRGSIATTTPTPATLVPIGALPAVLGGDLEVTLPTGERVPYANFDLAASAPCLAEVAEVVNAVLPHHASVHRGAGVLARRCTRLYEQARQMVADHTGCRPGDTVVFTRNTTDALNLLARVLPAGTRVVTFAAEHHANLLPWPTAVRLPVPGSVDEAVERVGAAVRVAGRQGGGPVLVAVTGASNVTGELWPVSEIAEVVHRAGGRVAVDAAQLAPHRPIDLATLGADYLAMSGHKLYAPFGAGVLVGRADWLDTAPPYLAGGGASGWVGDEPDQVAWVPGPGRHEGGTPNLLGAVALAKACAVLDRAARNGAVAHERQLLDRRRTGLGSIDGVTELSVFGPAQPRVGIVSFTVRGVAAGQVASRLATEHGVGVRAGSFCAHPLLRHLLSRDPSTVDWAAVRASLGLGTTAGQVDRLIQAVAGIAGRA